MTSGGWRPGLLSLSLSIISGKQSQAKPRPLFPAAVRQITIVQAERCDYIIFKERLE